MRSIQNRKRSPPRISSIFDWFKAMRIVVAISRAFADFTKLDTPTASASLAYYTLFSIAPLLYIVTLTMTSGAALFYGADAAQQSTQHFLNNQLLLFVGDKEAAGELASMIAKHGHEDSTSLSFITGLIGTVVGATGLVASLQSSLNRVWRTSESSNHWTLRLVLERVFSMGMILSLGLILLVSLLLSTLLTGALSRLAHVWEFQVLATVVASQLIGLLASWFVVVFVFKFVPSASVSWRQAMIGGSITVVFFMLGRIFLTLYIGYSRPGANLENAASSLMVIVVWVYYSYMILLLGASVTRNLEPTRPTPRITETSWPMQIDHRFSNPESINKGLLTVKVTNQPSENVYRQVLTRPRIQQHEESVSNRSSRNPLLVLGVGAVVGFVYGLMRIQRKAFTLADTKKITPTNHSEIDGTWIRQ